MPSSKIEGRHRFLNFFKFPVIFEGVKNLCSPSILERSKS